MLYTENRFKSFPFTLPRTAILQMFAAQQQDGSVGAQAMSKILIQLLEGGQSQDFGSDQRGTVTAFPPNSSLQESNSLPRHEQLYVPWAVTRVKVSCSDTVSWVLHSCTASSHRSKDFPVSLKCVRKSVLPRVLSQRAGNRHLEGC